jgi:hypothetical protein
MTDNDVLKARARLAYGQIKTAGKNDFSDDKNYNGDQWAQQQDSAPTSENRKMKINEVRKRVQDAVWSGNDNPDTLANIAKDVGDEQLVNQIHTEMARTHGLQVGNQKALEDPEAGKVQVAVGEEASLPAAIDQNRANIDAENARLRANLGWGAGAGALAGAGVGFGTYGLMGLFPSLRKRRLLRALTALGVGAGAGVGAGYLVTHNLNNGKIQDAYAGAKSRVGNAIDALKGKAQA